MSIIPTDVAPYTSNRLKVVVRRRQPLKGEEFSRRCRSWRFSLYGCLLVGTFTLYGSLKYTRYGEKFCFQHPSYGLSCNLMMNNYKSLNSEHRKVKRIVFMNAQFKSKIYFLTAAAAEANIM